jgi:hypothetical protein
MTIELQASRAKVAELERQLASARKTVLSLKADSQSYTKCYDYSTVAELLQQAYILGLRRDNCDEGRLERLLNAAMPRGGQS